MSQTLKGNPSATRGKTSLNVPLPHKFVNGLILLILEQSIVKFLDFRVLN
jgi:hypothetical protein